MDTKLADYDECVHAAEQLGFTNHYPGEGNWTNTATGCTADDNYIYFNTNENGKHEFDTTQLKTICRKKATGTFSFYNIMKIEITNDFIPRYISVTFTTYLSF